MDRLFSKEYTSLKHQRKHGLIYNTSTTLVYNMDRQKYQYSLNPLPTHLFQITPNKMHTGQEKVFPISLPNILDRFLRMKDLQNIQISWLRIPMDIIR